MIDLEQFSGGYVYVHCPEEWMANKLLEELESRGYKWYSGDDPTSFSYYDYANDGSCYGLDLDNHKISHIHINRISPKMLVVDFLNIFSNDEEGEYDSSEIQEWLANFAT